jgi:predicted nucleic acid-binding Zn finger protein
MAEQSVQQEQGSDGRYQRAIDLFWDAAFERTSKSPEVWVVETSYGSINEVDLDRGLCSCKDFEMHTHINGFRCKHVIAADLKSRWLRKNVRELAPYFGGEAA